jgi:hypothetical protein
MLASMLLLLLQTTVGAGLPVVSTLKELIETGDRVLSIEGILSGTLSFIFNSFKPGMAFSEVGCMLLAFCVTQLLSRVSRGLWRTSILIHVNA